MRLWATVVLSFLVISANPAAAADGVPDDPLAEKFGTMPALWYVRFSPEGQKVSFLQAREKGFPVLTVVDTINGEVYVPLGSDPGVADLAWCEWANAERLLCGLRAVTQPLGQPFYVTRLVAVDYDAKAMNVLLEDELRDRFAQRQDQIVDWLVDDPEHVLVQVPKKSGMGANVGRLDIYDGDVDIIEETSRPAYTWLSDGYGTPRLYQYVTRRHLGWNYRLAESSDWQTLFSAELEDLPDFSPVGFGADRNTLFVAKPHEGRRALFAVDLDDGTKERLVFAHDNVDVDTALTLGKHNRLAAIGYQTDRQRFHFFDDRIETIVKEINALFPEKIVSVMDESWDQRYYLVRVASDVDPGTYYRFDRKERRLAKISEVRPGLADMELAPMEPMSYTARDGVEVPGYLTKPVNGPETDLPTVILPHGGPEARDQWGFDWIAHYLAAKGYAVLQTNFRGSAGFGDEWAGEGGFKAWRQAMADIGDGARALIEDGTADPDRICIAGASYGGYAAMMSAILDPEIYQCVVSIAGVSGLDSLMREQQNFVGYEATEEFIGTNAEHRDRASPERRADEIQAPVLLIHGEDDVNVDVDHSEDMEGELEDAGQEVELIKYEDIDHYFQRGAVRADMLARIGAFLDRHIGEQMESASR